MVSRIGLPPNTLGTYSELAVALAFVARGCCVTLPFGNQPGWDLLVQEGGVWLRVQVKTLKLTPHALPFVSLIRHGRAGRNRDGALKGLITAADADVIIAVHPESGVMWRVPAVLFTGNAVRLTVDLLWRGSIAPAALPLSASVPVMEMRLRSRLALAGDRQGIRDRLPADRPDNITEKNWTCVLNWCAGDGYKVLGLKQGISACAVRERVIRTLNRFGLAELPAALLRANGRAKTLK